MKTEGNRAKKPAIQNNASKFPVVGIGASAGGLEAFETFFKAMPDDLGITFILVAHLDPSHTSILPEILQKKTRMKVSQVVDNMKIAPNQVFIIPPNKDLALLNGRLQLFELKKPRGANLPIDNFFRSLAQDQGDKAIGIILSGTGTDGTLGIRAIKGEAGMAMVQDPQTARYDGMPQSAITSGLVDYILPVDKMPQQLVKYVRHQRDQDGKTKTGDEKMLNALQKIYVLLRAATDHDFSQYKKNTILRRIERRMHVQQIDHVDDYVRYLQESNTEVGVLFKELLIGVTSFFRDPVAFDLLKENFLPELLKVKPDDYQMRIWVPGCSSGEEAYSIAIALRECMESLGHRFTVQIFGTDLDPDAINTARIGKYPESIAADLTPERLQRFFVKEDTRYQVKKALREMVVFAPQNIIKDPPFTKLDLLCCRNLLIYFRAELQHKLLPLFHYSLKKDGLLFLGSSETIGQFTDLFVALDKKWKIFRRQQTSDVTHPVLNFPVSEPAVEEPEKNSARPRKQQKELNTTQLLKAVLAQSNMPPSVIIDDRADIVYVHGRTGRFLEPAEGEASTNVLTMARPGLSTALANSIRKMAIERREIKVKNLQLEDDYGRVDFNLILRPLQDIQIGRRGLIMVIFEEIALSGETAASGSQVHQERSSKVKRLEEELQFTKENLQTTIEELETSNEELKSTNEELQSTNEELQSTNEELETSKEELQSLNEESATVNSELQSRIDELVAANDDIKNLLDATEIATIFLDINLQVRRFTPKSTELFHLTATDIGRPIEHFATTLKGVRLVDCAAEVIKDLGQHESEVEDEKNNRFRMRIRPYRTLNNVIAGVVITFEDITKYKEVVDALTESETIWRGLVENAPMGIFILSEERFAYLNPGALALFGAASQEEIMGTAVADRVHRDSHEFLAGQIGILINDRKSMSALKGKWLQMDGQEVDLVLSVTPITYKKKMSALVFIR